MTVHCTVAERRLLVSGVPLPASKPAIGQVPRSALLDTLQHFLPGMQKANAELETRMQARVMPRCHCGGARRAHDVLSTRLVGAAEAQPPRVGVLTCYGNAASLARCTPTKFCVSVQIQHLVTQSRHRQPGRMPTKSSDDILLRS